MKVAVLAGLALAASGQTSSLEQAKRAFDAGKYVEAARLFEAAGKSNPACEISLYLGMTQYRLHQVDDALIAFGEAAKCNPKLTLAHLALGDAYAERGNNGEALAAYERALHLEPKNAAALRGAASLYTKSKADAKAVATLETLLQVEPKDAEAHADLGAEYFATGNEEGAGKEFGEAIRLNPKSAAGLLGQANLMIRRGEEEKAIVALRQVILLAPNAFEPRFILGSAYNRAGKFADAAEQLEAAVKMGGTESEIYYHLARAYAGLGRTEERKAVLAKFAEVSSQAKAETEARRVAAQLVDEAKVLVASGDLEAAFTRMVRAKDLRPHDDSILFRLASLGYDLAHYDQARQAIEEAIEVSPSEWIYHFLLGLIEGRSGRLTQARASLDIAVRLNPLAADAHNALGEVAMRQGDRKVAEKSFMRAAELDPGQPAYKQNLETSRKAGVK